ncbi:MAG: nicotinate-nucleotide adenylyltransferase [Coriobacteriia bacterium]|nr:nicotinate-nucleotide adenylyltransferase [Coriobacteriia bacterium]
MVRFAREIEKIGILGGTFDPVHNAHMDLAQAALESHSLDKVLFVPTGQPVRKLGKTFADPQHRFNMLQAVCADIEGFEVSPLEIMRPEITYSVDTLRELRTLYGEESKLFLILGEDTATDLPTWKDAHEIAQLVVVLYAKRPGSGTDRELPQEFTCIELPMDAQELSSSLVRSMLFAGKDVQDLIPPQALSYIREQRLYGQSL